MPAVRLFWPRIRGGAAIAYRFEKTDHDVIDGLRRIAAEEIDAAVTSAEAEGELGPRVHDIRKRMKKLRGLIRLVRPVFPDYAAENARFRDLGASLAAARDAEVKVETLDRVIGKRDASRFSALTAELASARPAAPDLGPVVEALHIARERVGAWTLHETGWDAVAGGLGKTYRRARRLRRAKDDAGLHGWRKRIKDHWYHTRLLADLWPEGMAAREAAADEVGEHLGLHHDLVVLEAGLDDAPLSKAADNALRRLTARRKAELETSAREIAPRILGDKPKALVAGWGELWEAWRS